MSRRTDFNETIASQVQNLVREYEKGAKNRSKIEVKQALEGYLNGLWFADHDISNDDIWRDIQKIPSQLKAMKDLTKT